MGTSASLQTCAEHLHLWSSRWDCKSHLWVLTNTSFYEKLSHKDCFWWLRPGRYQWGGQPIQQSRGAEDGTCCSWQAVGSNRTWQSQKEMMTRKGAG